MRRWLPFLAWCAALALPAAAQNPYIQITTTSPLPGGYVGIAYSNFFRATTYNASPATWSIAATQPSSLTGPPPSPLSITTGNLSATVGVEFSQTLSASGGTPPYSFTLTSGTLPARLTFTPATATLSGTPTAAGTSSVSFTVSDSSGLTSGKTITITVSTATPPSVTVTVGSGSASVGAAQQVPVNLSLSNAYSADITATLTLTFQSSVGGDDQTVQFITSTGGTRNLSLTITAGSVAPATAPVLATGTVAGTITITTQLSSPGVTFPQPSPTTVTVAKGVPVIQSVAFSNTGGGLTVTVIGYSTTRDMVSGDFTFAPATGSTLAQSDIQVQLGSAFSTWYQNSSSSAFGSQFKLTMPFTVSGNAANVISVIVKLTNSFGTSIAVSPQ